MIIQLLLALFMFADTSHAAAPSIIIEIVEVGSPSANDEYIVLRNTTSEPVDISKWSIQSRTNGSSTVQKKNFNPETIIGPQESYRIAHAHGRFAATAHMTYTTLSLVEKGGILGLFNTTSYATTFEESSLTNSYFYTATSSKDISTSQAAPTSSTPPTKAVTKNPEYIGTISETAKIWPVRLSELFPNPTTGDEYIEIENTSNEGVDVSGLWLKDASGASYALGSRGENTVLGAYEPRIWSRTQTRLALNNTDGEVVILSDQTNGFRDEVFYTQDVAPDIAYARLGKSWLWTTRPTPSTKNSIAAQQFPPYARAEIPRTPIQVNKVFTVSAADSTDLNDSIVSYEWNFGDGTTRYGISQSYNYSATGTFPVSLLITDTFGATSSVSRDVTVIDNKTSTKKIIVSAAALTGIGNSKKKTPPITPQYSGIVQIPPGIIGRRRFVMNGRTVEFTTDRKELPLLQRGSVISFSAKEVFKTDRLLLQITARDTVKVAALTTAPPYTPIHGTVTSVEKNSFQLATTSTDYLVQSGLRYSNGNRIEVNDTISLSGVLLNDDSEKLTIVVPNNQFLTLIDKAKKESEIPSSFYNLILLACTTGSLILIHLFLTRYGKKYAPVTPKYLQNTFKRVKLLFNQVANN